MGHILGDPDLGVQGSTTNSSTIIPGELSQNMMDEKRVDAASVVINQAGLWVTGGRNFKDEKNSTEIFFWIDLQYEAQICQEVFLVTPWFK